MKTEVNRGKSIDFADPKYYINRELSWLQFNERVLDEARRKDNPLFERLKFLAITSSNLDEFFMVRVASLKDMLNADYRKRDIAGLTVNEQLDAVLKATHEFVDLQYSTYNRSLIPALKQEASLELCQYEDLTPEEERYISDYYENDIYPVLTPMAVDSSRPFPLILNKTLNIGALLRRRDSGDRSILFRSKKKKKEEGGSEELDFATVQVPSGLPRMLWLPVQEGKPRRGILLEEVIRHNMPKLFLNYDVICAYPFRLMRNADLSIDEDEAEDLLKEIEKQLRRRQWGEAIRLEAEQGIDARLLAILEKELRLQENEIFYIDGPLDLTFLMKVSGLEGYDVFREHRYAAPQNVPEIPAGSDLFERIRSGDIFMHHPYESFQPVVSFVAQAAVDPDVLAIKQTLYRVSGDSPIIAALIKAAENGKQVTVIVELKARFDEGNNIVWARRLDESGAHVVYGIAGLKIHGKAMLIIRRSKGVIRRYCHLATGNYNDKTARLYTDIGIFSNDETLCGDVAALFNVMTGYAAPMTNWAKLAVSPFDLRRKFLELIDREARLSTPHMPGRIIAKMNALVDSEIITHLYEAAAAGVEIDLIVRGICCLNPGVAKGKIRVISIVDRYLEHSRIFYFANGGNDEYYMSSADWMPRNLDRRIEILFPVEDERIREQLKQLLKAEREDTRKGRRLLDNGSYTRTCNRTDDRNRSQKRIYDDLDRWNEAIAAADSKKLMIFKKKKHTKKTDVHAGSGSLTGGRSVQKG